MPRFSPTPPINRPTPYDRPVKQEVYVDIVTQAGSGDEASMALVPKAKGKAKAKVSNSNVKGAKFKAKVKPEASAEDATDGDEDGDGSAGKARGGYDRALLVNLVAKASKADWTGLAYAVNKSASQCRDTWRKTVFPALVDGRAWAVAGPGWDVAMKLHLAREVLGVSSLPSRISQLTSDGAAGMGRHRHLLSRPYLRAYVHDTSLGPLTPEVHDVWRKVVLPRLMSGKALH